MDTTQELLATWMPHQRWYSAKGRTPALRIVAAWESSDPRITDAVRVRTLLVADDSAQPATVYQVPVVERPTSTVRAEPDRVIGSPRTGTTLVDGPSDEAYAAALLRLVTRGGEEHGPEAGVRGIPLPSAPAPDGYRPEVLRGEQSNTSIVYHGPEGTTPIIVKVFRQLHPGLNPDIELQTALARSGSPYVPAAIGALTGWWPGSASEGSIAFAQEFLPGVRDAWVVALRAATSGEDFAAPARELGVATAAVHRSLAELFGAAPASADEQALLTGAWHRRLAVAIAELPGLAGSRERIEAVYDRATRTVWPALQRVHGDFHLGQAILVPGRGWRLLDFEGEPLRPMTERVRPDLALRDVAGMLRSFDYVAGSVRRAHPDRPRIAARAWADAARTAFLGGYAAESGADLDAHRALQDALELDKAVYEAIYEARNRPDWVEIPTQAIARLVGER